MYLYLLNINLFNIKMKENLLNMPKKKNIVNLEPIKIEQNNNIYYLNLIVMPERSNVHILSFENESLHFYLRLFYK